MAPLDWGPGEDWTLSEVQDHLDRERMRIGLPPIRPKKKPEEELPEEYLQLEHGTYVRTMYVGLDLGKKQDFSAVALVAPFYPSGTKTHYSYHVSQVKRYDLGTPYPRIARALRSIDEQLRADDRWQNIIYVVDEGGVGAGVTDQAVELLPNADIYRVTLTGGARPHWHTSRDVSLPKPQMASRMIALMEGRRMLINSKEFDSGALRDELYNYEEKISSVGHETFGAMKIGTHDDIVCAIAMCAWISEDSGGGTPLSIW